MYFLYVMWICGVSSNEDHGEMTSSKADDSKKNDRITSYDVRITAMYMLVSITLL